MLRVWRLIQGGYAIVKERETFASRLGFVLISAGCAIGLGNVWRFPYIVGQYGGAAFVLIYLLFLVIMGLPIMAMEFSVGRASRKSILASFQVLEPKGSKWHWYGWFGMAGNYLLMMFYTTIAGCCFTSSRWLPANSGAWMPPVWKTLSAPCRAT